MAQDFIYLTGLIISSVVLIAAFTLRTHSRKPCITLLLLGDSGLIASHLFYSFNRQPNTAMALIIFAIINALILWKICSKENVDQWPDAFSSRKAGMFYRNTPGKSMPLSDKPKTNEPEIKLTNPVSFSAMIGLIVLMPGAPLLII